MKKIVALLACGCLLSGCSLETLAGLAGVQIPRSPQPGVDTNLTQDEVLSAYTQTFATGSNTLTDELADGLEGMAAGPSLPNSALTTGTFKTAVVKVASNKQTMTIKADGRTYTLRSFNGGAAVRTLAVNGQPYKVYHFTKSGQQLQTNDDLGAHIEGQYSSIDAMVKGVISPYAYDNGGFLIVASGLTTPINAMPTQIVVYDGYWAMITKHDYNEGTFTANVNFANHQVNYSTSNYGGQVLGGGTATVTGNKLKGTFSSTGNIVGSGQVVGEFYGPHAEEVAGVMNGTASGDVLGGTFFGRAEP